MPNRYLRDGILDSDPVNSLSWEAEVFYRRLMSAVDDFGRFDGRISILRSRLYALKPNVRDTDISHWIAACVKAGLIAVYQVGGKPYILFHKLGDARAKSSKYPPPDEGVRERLNGGDNVGESMPVGDSSCEHVRADENICSQTPTNASITITTSITNTNTNKYPPTPHGGDGDQKPKRKRERPPKDLNAMPWTEDAVPLPHGPEFRDAWMKWLSTRAARRKPVTNLAARLALEKLERAGLTAEEAAACVFDSAANDWQGLFPEKVATNRPAGNLSAKKHDFRTQAALDGAAMIDAMIAQTNATPGLTTGSLLSIVDGNHAA